MGAWCLGHAECYETPPVPVVDVLQALANLEVVVKRPPCRPRPAHPGPLRRGAVGRGVEAYGGQIAGGAGGGRYADELEEFLRSHSLPRLPHTVEVFLRGPAPAPRPAARRGAGPADQVRRRRPGPVLAGDSQLRGKVHLAGEKWLVFRGAARRRCGAAFDGWATSCRRNAAGLGRPRVSAGPYGELGEPPRFVGRGSSGVASHRSASHSSRRSAGRRRRG